MVAATTRTSILIVRSPPTRLMVRCLEHAQQLGLEREVELADLVEEDGAAVGLLEAAVLRSTAPVNAALLVAEQRALDQLARDRAAVEDHERLAACAAPRCSARATSSLPVPVSPLMSTVSSLGATFSSGAKISRMRRPPDQLVERVARRGVDLDDVVERLEAEHGLAHADGLAGLIQTSRTCRSPQKVPLVESRSRRR